MSEWTDLPPVIAIDGPSASGKGTVAQRVAQRLGFHYLDSGALYRSGRVGGAQVGRRVGTDEAALVRLAAALDVRFEGDEIYLNQARCDGFYPRSEEGRRRGLPSGGFGRQCGRRCWCASVAFRQPPGLVADGRDMGSVVFPDAALKIYLTADAAERAPPAL